MVRLTWLPAALSDVSRVHAFLWDLDADAAARAAASILAGADLLREHPHAGRPLADGRREHVVPFGAAAYVLRYRVAPDGGVVVIRVWHSREHR